MSLTFSVIVNTYQRADSLALTLSSLEQIDYSEFEVIVVNGPSIDHTNAVLERYKDQVTVGRCLDRNLARSRNIGIRMAQGEVVAFIDDDAYPDPAWLDRLAEAYDDPTVAAAGGPVYNYTGSDIQAWRSYVDRFGNSRVEHCPTDHPYGASSVPFASIVPYTIGTNSSFRREVLVANGGFDETFEYYLEESDLCCRLVDLGHLIAQLDDGFVYHKFLPSWVRERPDVVKDYRQILKSKIYFALKHGMADASFFEVCGDVSRFVETCREQVETALVSGLLSADDRAKFESDVAEMSDVALSAWSAPLAAIRSPDWFTGQSRPFRTFPTRRPPGGRLHVCLLSQEYPPSRVNGIGRVVHAIATGLADAGHLVRVVTGGSAYRRVDLEDGVWVHRVPVTHHPQPSLLAVPGRLWDYSASVFDEVCRIQEHRPLDIVQAPNWDSEGIAAIEDGRLPVVVGLYTPLKTLIRVDRRFGEAVQGPDHTLQDMVELERLCYLNADGVLACGAAIIDEVDAQYGVRLADRYLGIVPHGLSDRALDLPFWEKTDEGVELLYVGRLEPRKGADILLEAAPALLEHHPNMVITVAGDDSFPTAEGPTLRAQFEARVPPPVAARVRFLGPVEDAELMPLYARCDIVVVPSRYESFGLMLLEAMMFSKPVVASDVGGMREIVQDGVTGLLAPPGDRAGFIAAVETMAGDAELRRRLGIAGRAEFEERFTRERMVDGIVGYYRSVLASANRRSVTTMHSGADRS